MGIWGSVPRHVAEQLRAPSAEVANEGTVHAFVTWCLINWGQLCILDSRYPGVIGYRKPSDGDSSFKIRAVQLGCKQQRHFLGNGDKRFRLNLRNLCVGKQRCVH
jgi:hypothetical protein